RGSRQSGVPGSEFSRWIGFGADRAAEAEAGGFIATPRQTPGTTTQAANRLRRDRAAPITRVIVGTQVSAATRRQGPRHERGGKPHGGTSGAGAQEDLLVGHESVVPDRPLAEELQGVGGVNGEPGLLKAP